MIINSDAELDTYLDELFELEGIIAAMVCNNSATPLAAKMPSVFDESAVNKLAKKFSQILASVKELKIKQDIITFSYEEGAVILKDLKRGFLLIFCSIPELNPLMEMSFKMTSKRLIRYLSFGKRKNTENTETTTSEDDVSLDTVHQVDDEPMIIESEKIRQFNTELTKFLGPVAGVAIKKKASKLGYSWNTLPISKFDEFLQSILVMIESKKDQDLLKKYTDELFEVDL